MTFCTLIYIYILFTLKPCTTRVRRRLRCNTAPTNRLWYNWLLLRYFHYQIKSEMFYFCNCNRQDRSRTYQCNILKYRNSNVFFETYTKPSSKFVIFLHFHQRVKLYSSFLEFLMNHARHNVTKLHVCRSHEIIGLYL